MADCKGFVTVGEYLDGRPGELFIRVSKQGSTMAGIMDAFAISVSHGLQYGVPLRAFVHAFVGMRFEPAGMTDDPEVRIANSLIDYLFRRLALDYLPYEERLELGILGTSERLQPTLPGVEEYVAPTGQGLDLPPDPVVPSSGRRVRCAGVTRAGGGARRRRPRHRCGRTDVHAVRGAHDPRRLVLRLRGVRHHQRLLLNPATTLDRSPRGRRSRAIADAGYWPWRCSRARCAAARLPS